MKATELSEIELQVNKSSEKNSSVLRRHVPTHQAALILVLALTFVAYCGTLAFEFVSDDHLLIEQNIFVHAWRYAPRYFTCHMWNFVYPEMLGNFYRPLFLLWLRANHMLFGLNPWAWHLTNVLLHIAVTALVYLLAVKLVADRLTAVFAAAIFGLHPVHIEAVAWVSDSADLLLALCFLSAFYCYLRKREGGGRAKAWALASIFLFVAALLSKEAALVFPVFVFAYELMLGPPRIEGNSPQVSEHRLLGALRCVGPYLAIFSLYLGARVIVIKGFSHAVTPLPLATIVLTCPSLFWFYVKLLIWPVGLSPAYDVPYVTGPGFSNLVLPIMGLAATGFVLWACARRPDSATLPDLSRTQRRVLMFATVWTVVSIIPVFDLTVLLKDDIAHGRYLYLSSVGFSILVAIAFRSLWLARKKRIFGQPAIQAGALGVVLIFFLVEIILQSPVWANDLLLYSRAAATAPHNNWVKTNLGYVMGKRGMYDVGIKIYQEILASDPEFWAANMNLGHAYFTLGRLGESERYLRRAIGIEPGRAEQYLCLGLVLLDQGRLSEAQAAIRQAVQIRPEAVGYHYALGLVMSRRGNLAGAVSEFEAELTIDPENQAAREELAKIRAHPQNSSNEAAPSSSLRPLPSWPGR